MQGSRLECDESASAACARRRVRVQGRVQGVGFRPFVYRLAREMGLSGWVRKGADGVEIEIQGPPGDLSALIARLHGEAPAAARIERVDSEACAVLPGDRGFTVASSHHGESSVGLGEDRAVCADCLAEMCDPASRRWRYPFVACAQCGPRYTIARSAPGYRVNTSMAAFVPCPACHDDCAAVGGRHFHAEFCACPQCGPRLALLEAYGVTVASRDPVADALARLLAGEIVAVKGPGGFHLMCDARNGEAVARLRERKSRAGKPFAVMVAGLAAARHWARLGGDDEALLASAERPVVLCARRPSVDAELPGVAPGVPAIGLTLPFSPLHYLLFHDFAGRPAGTAWIEQPLALALACTSANPGGEPLVRDNREATRRLTGIADAYLIHDRDIVVRCDDSVVRALPPRHAGEAARQFIRRARGYTPAALRLAGKGAAVLAFGGERKNMLCMTRGDEAFLSQQFGDLDGPGALHAVDEVADALQRLLGVAPEAVAHDADPASPACAAALALAARLGVPAHAVDHRHAHIAAVQAEHRHRGALLGLALDGNCAAGGNGGSALLRLEAGGFVQLGGLAGLALPGADAAACAPWRLAALVLQRLGRGDEIARRFAAEPEAWRMAERLAARRVLPQSSGLGRWIEAAAGLLGVCHRPGYDGEAAQRLERLAAGFGAALPLAGGWRLAPDGTLDLMPLLARLADERDPGHGAALFLATLAAALEDWTVRLARGSGIDTVALAGGCFLDPVLARDLARRLVARGFDVLEARAAPPHDGGLALGQACVVRERLGAH